MFGTYRVRYLNNIICTNVDEATARAICQLLLFQTRMGLIEKFDVESVEIIWEEPISVKRLELINFINK